MNSYHKYTKDIVITGMTNVVIVLRGLVLLPLLSKTLGAYGYGIWAQVTVTLFLIACISTLNLPGSLARFLAAEKDREAIREGFFSVLIAGVGFSLLIALVLFMLSRTFAASLLHDPSAVNIAQLTALVVPFWAMETVYLGFFRAFREMKRYSVLLISRNFIEMGLISYLVLSGYGIFGAVLSLLVARVVVDAFMLFIIIGRIGIKWPRFSRLRQFLNFGVPLIPGMLASWVTSSSDRYIIGILLGVTPVGIYAAGYSIGYVITYFTAPLAMVLLPTLSRLYDENRLEEVKTYLAYSLKYFLMLAIPSVFGLVALAKPLLNVLSTPEFVPEGSVVIPFIAVSYTLFGVYVIFSQVLILVNQTRILGISWGLAALLNLALNIIFVPKFGVIAAAASTLLCYTLVAGVTVFVSTKCLRFSLTPTFILKSIVASSVMAAILWLINPVGVVSVVLAIGLSSIIYIVVLLLGRGFAKNELSFFRQLFRKD
jgi:O-antigen/teichoic acid export membrane protein